MERTFVIIKPDAIERKLAGEIISKFEKKGYKLLAMSYRKLDEAIVKEHYAHISHIPPFKDIVDFMTSDNVLLMVIGGTEVAKTVKEMVGATFRAFPGTIRGDFALPFSDNGANLIHASDNAETAEIEIARFKKYFENL